MIFSFDIFFYIAEEYMLNNLNLMRVRYELEYSLNCSPKVLFSRLSTPEGLSEWFAEDVTSDGDTFTFHWNKIQYQARLVALKENKLVRFEWADPQDDDSNFFEFKINVQDLTGDLALLITDFSEPDEKEDAIYLWDTQISDLKRVLGI
jgi:uncharacterized protein YndB with AHSA1/START domain